MNCFSKNVLDERLEQTMCNVIKLHRVDAHTSYGKAFKERIVLFAVNAAYAFITHLLTAVPVPIYVVHRYVCGATSTQSSAELHVSLSWMRSRCCGLRHIHQHRLDDWTGAYVKILKCATVFLHNLWGAYVSRGLRT